MNQDKDICRYCGKEIDFHGGRLRFYSNGKGWRHIKDGNVFCGAKSLIKAMPANGAAVLQEESI